jgi:hypothetical protein
VSEDTQHEEEASRGILILICSVLAVLLLSLSSSFVYGAEVGCIEVYDGKSIDEAAASQLRPAGFRPVAGMCKRAYIRGTITRGDYEKVRALYRASHPLLSVFALASEGGSVAEAMQIGNLFRNYLISANAPNRINDEPGFLTGTVDKPVCVGPECVCASACALIWFGAVDRFGVIGLHRPRIDDPDFKGMPPADAAKLYRQVLDQMERYLAGMEAPRPLIDAMLETASSSIRWIKYDRDGLSRPPSYAEWADASCGSVSDTEFSRGADLSIRKYVNNQTLTNSDELFLAKFVEHGRCNLCLRFGAVERMPLP